MASNRAEKMGARAGLPGILDNLRYHELSRQGIGLLLLPVCAWFAMPGALRVIIGLAVAMAGQGWRIYAAGVIYKNQQLATTGAYSLVRHPLYLGNFLILGGFTLAGANWGMAVAVIFFLVFYYPPAIHYEDKKLEAIFADRWRAWSRDIPAVFPTRWHWVGNNDAEWNARQSLLRNGELPISVYILLCAGLLTHRAGLM